MILRRKFKLNAGKKPAANSEDRYIKPPLAWGGCGNTKGCSEQVKLIWQERQSSRTGVFLCLALYVSMTWKE